MSEWETQLQLWARKNKVFDFKEEADVDIDTEIRAVEKLDLQLSKAHAI